MQAAGSTRERERERERERGRENALGCIFVHARPNDCHLHAEPETECSGVRCPSGRRQIELPVQKGFM